MTISHHNSITKLEIFDHKKRAEPFMRFYHHFLHFGVNISIHQYPILFYAQTFFFLFILKLVKFYWRWNCNQILICIWMCRFAFYYYVVRTQHIFYHFHYMVALLLNQSLLMAAWWRCKCKKYLYTNEVFPVSGQCSLLLLNLLFELSIKFCYKQLFASPIIIFAVHNVMNLMASIEI